MELFTERAYDAIKRDVLSCALPPGAVINEKQLAESLGVSKTPVRQAISRLAAEGFVEVFPRQGTLVRHIGLREIKDVYTVRELVEPGANALAAARATADDIRRLTELDDEQLSSGTPEELDLAKHAAFHVAVAAIARVPQLTEIVTRLHDQLQWILASQAADGGPMPPKANHHRLVDAIRRRDPEQAKAITQESIRLSREQLLRDLVEQP